jgi:hypothetical protein
MFPKSRALMETDDLFYISSTVPINEVPFQVLLKELPLRQMLHP